MSYLRGIGALDWRSLATAALPEYKRTQAMACPSGTVATPPETVKAGAPACMPPDSVWVCSEPYTTTHYVTADPSKGECVKKVDGRTGEMLYENCKKEIIPRPAQCAWRKAKEGQAAGQSVSVNVKALTETVSEQAAQRKAERAIASSAEECAKAGVPPDFVPYCADRFSLHRGEGMSRQEAMEATIPEVEAYAAEQAAAAAAEADAQARAARNRNLLIYGGAAAAAVVGVVLWRRRKKS